ncbi:MAG TPA: HDOD domain-containing protein [Acidimicrobiales bacterium]|nr:HDOD domain-containing protein [Acidimicrobiales bacterium]
MSRSDVLVGRQPIFDRARNVLGYELVLRPDGGVPPRPDARGAPADGDLLTTHVLFSSLAVGVDRFVGDKLMFCDVNEDLLTGDTALLLPPERSVLEVPTGALYGSFAVTGGRLGCLRLVEEGYTLALDDFWWSEGAEDLFHLFSFVKVDPRRHGPDGVAAVVERCRPFDVRVLVQTIDTESAFHQFEELGADLFQGYLLSTPQPVPGRVIDPGEFTKTRLAARLLEPDAGIAEVEALVRADPALSLQLLHMAGIGAAGGMRRTVSTVREALVLVGWRRLQAWVSMLLLAGGRAIGEELMTATLVRARMCELLGGRIGGGRTEMAFTVGMLSGLDVLLGVPLEDVLRDLPLDDDVRDAVLEHSGPVGQLVADVIDYQLGRPECATRSGLGAHVLQAACFDALAWGIEMTTGLDAAALV